MKKFTEYPAVNREARRGFTLIELLGHQGRQGWMVAAIIIGEAATFFGIECHFSPFTSCIELECFY